MARRRIQKRPLASLALAGLAQTLVSTASAQESTAPDEEEPIVEVQGSRPHPTAIPSAPGTSGTHLGQDAFRPAGTALPDALRNVPGLAITQTGGLGAPATARVRGASAAQTAVYLGSIRLNDEVGGTADLSTIPTSLIGSVDVYRSLTPRFTALEGMGGTILITPRVPRAAEATSKLTFGSFTSERLELSLAGCHEETSCLLVGADLTQAENDYPFYDSRGILLVDDDGQVARLPNADSAQGSGFLTGTTKLGQADVLLFLEHTSREQGAPKLALVPSREARARFQRSSLGLELDVPVDELNGSAAFTSNIVLAGTALADPLLEMGLGTTAVQTPGRRFEQAVRLDQRPTSWLVVEEHLTLSYEGIDRLEEVEGRTDVALSASRLSSRLALGAEVAPLPHASANIRVSMQCLDTSEGSLDFCTQVVPGARGGVLWQKGSFDAYLNVARAARPPTLSELYGVSLLMRGNEALEPEVAVTLETGVRQHFPKRGEPRLWLDASTFARFADDLIVFTRTAQGFLRPENRDKTRTLGAELLVGTQPLSGLVVEANASFLDPRDTSPDRVLQNDILPFLSRFMASARIEQRIRVASESLRTLRFGLSTHYESSRYADSAGLAVVPEQSFTDFTLGSAWFPRPTPRPTPAPSASADDKALLTVDFRFSNLFDQVRYDIVGFPLPGRAWFVSLGLELP